MIQLKKIQFRYPESDFELFISDLTFPESSKTAVIGPSGFGKTTMLNLIAGILLPDKGEVIVNNAILNSQSDKERRNYRIQNIGFIFQDFRLVPYLSVLDNILLPFRINSIIKPDADASSRAKHISEDLNIGKLIKKYPAKLSHGEKQRVAIARALINKPKVLLADEPTGNLDPVNKLNIKDILFDVVGKYNTTLITVTHDHEMLDGFDNVIDFKNFKKVTES
ncbi:MAG: ABC transporter ATP-binding protein [Eudoraea sp.]|uniref:ABC transporter ATP-binding protein n=1 Tax=Eudoraea sp. TaxID=1979955 RepID=UPI0032659416